jgi:hypothetical protein
MGVITLKIDEDLEEKLRKRVGRTRGAERGAISQSVEQAIRLWLKAPPDMESKQRDDAMLYIAKKNSKKVAEANSLASLSFKLKEVHIDPRDVIVESIPKVPSERKMGLRTTAYRQK